MSDRVMLSPSTCPTASIVNVFECLSSKYPVCAPAFSMAILISFVSNSLRTISLEMAWAALKTEAKSNPSELLLLVLSPHPTFCGHAVPWKS